MSTKRDAWILKVFGGCLAITLLWTVGGWLIETFSGDEKDRSQEWVDIDALFRASEAYRVNNGIEPSNLQEIKPFFVALTENTSSGAFTSRAFSDLQNRYVIRPFSSSRSPWIIPRSIKPGRQIIWVAFRSQVAMVSASEFKRLMDSK